MNREKIEKFLISIVAWLLLISGAASVLLSVFTFSIENLLQSLYLFAVGIIVIKTSSGIRQMRRWALYIVTILFFIGLYDIFQSPKKLTVKMTIQIISLTVNLIAIPYFWTIYRKFK